MFGGGREAKNFGSFYQISNQMTVRGVSAALVHPKNPILSPFVAMPLASAMPEGQWMDGWMKQPNRQVGIMVMR